MSIDPYEAEMEAADLELYEQHRKQALEEFQSDRLQSYFLANPELAKLPVQILGEARSVAGSSPSAALALASAAAEVGLKSVLLKPVVVGLVHTEPLSGFVADLVVGHQGLDRFRDLLFAILREFGGIDLATHRRTGAGSTLWEEIRQNVSHRNSLLHRCQLANVADATNAVEVASEVLERLFPALLGRLGMHLHDGYRVCNRWHPPERFAKLLGGE